MGRRRRSQGGPDGICLVDKPGGWTSHDAVARTRRLLGTGRVGHAGTLDPMATGLLVMGVGRGTRLLTFVSGVDKSYEATITFGAETDSLDADGEVLGRHDMSDLDPDAVIDCAERLTGDLMQIPPMVSALKVDGRRLHELAREGKVVERAPRPVRVSRFEVTPTPDPLVWSARIDCSSGTYVRSLAADLGSALGGGAYLSSLRRTRVGPFHIDEATSLDEPVLLPLVQGVRHLASVTAHEEMAGSVRHGQVLGRELAGAKGTDQHCDGPWAGDGPWAVVDESGALLAVYEMHSEHHVKPAIVVASDGG